jgi:hypothetical protein
LISKGVVVDPSEAQINSVVQVGIKTTDKK